MSDNENNEGMIEVPQNTREAYQVRFPFVRIKLLEWQDLKTYDINIDQRYYGNDNFNIFKMPLTPYLRFSQDSDQLKQFHDNFKKTYNAIYENGRGTPAPDFYNKNRYPSFTPFKIVIKNDPRKEVSLIPGKLEEAEALVLVVPERRLAVTRPDHIERNKRQYGFAPRKMETMEVLVKCVFFKLYEGLDKGFSRTHNLRRTDDYYPVTRLLAFIFGTGIKENVDYRGVSKLSDGTGSRFKGMQFVYNVKSGNLVTDKLNKGTFDFRPPGESGNLENDSKANSEHYKYDIDPWIEWGNVIADDERIYMPQEIEDEIGSYIDKPISDEDKDSIYKLLTERSIGK